MLTSTLTNNLHPPKSAWVGSLGTFRFYAMFFQGIIRLLACFLLKFFNYSLPVGLEIWQINNVHINEITQWINWVYSRQIALLINLHELLKFALLVVSSRFRSRSCREWPLPLGPSRRPYPQSARTATCPLCGGSTPPTPGSVPSFSPRMTLPGNKSKWQLTTVPSTTQQHADSPPCELLSLCKDIYIME
jgi:hypothetical protein